VIVGEKSCMKNTALIALFCCALFASAADAQRMEPVLQASIQSDGWYQANKSKIAKGMIWSDDLLPELETSEMWYLMPKGLAGTWRQTKVGRTDLAYQCKFPIRKCSMTWSVVHQIDHEGGEWFYAGVPFVERADLGRRNAVYVTTGYQQRRADPSRYGQAVQCEQVINVIEYAKSNNKITNAYTQYRTTIRHGPSWQDWNLTTPLYSTRAVAMDGGTSWTESGADCRRVASFTPTDVSPAGKDLKRSFRQFLLSHALANLIPDSQE
jgi:hypothetical protein